MRHTFLISASLTILTAMDNASSSSYVDEVPTSAPAVFDKNLKFTLRIAIHTLVMILGVPGNSLILLVYKNKRQKTSTHIFIMTLAMADLSVCLMRVLDIVYEYCRVIGTTEYIKAINLLRPLEYTAVGTTIIITALIAADRYDSVCRPLRRFFGRRRAKIAALASLVTSLTVNIPALIEVIIDSSGQLLIVLVLAFQLIAYLINVILIIVCYRLVHITIRKHVKVGIASLSMAGRARSVASASTPNNTNILPPINQVGSSTSADETGTNSGREHNIASISSRCARISPSEANAKPKTFGNKLGLRVMPKERAPASVLQRKTTRMLFITSVVFLLTWLAYWIFVGKVVARLLGVGIDPIFNAVTDEARSLVYVNNVFNPLIYGFSNSRFRKDCQVILRKMKCC